MSDEPDWSQQDATQEQVKAWMREEIKRNHMTPDTLAWRAHEHFHRPYHLDVLKEWAKLALSGK